MLETDKLIILCYRPGAGGKFLANCLGVSSHCVLQDKFLAQQQISGNLDTKQKFDLLINRIDQTQQIWNDLDLGDVQYFGRPVETITDESQLNFVCKTVHDSNLFFIACVHNIKTLEHALLHWPNAKVINLTNSVNFLNTYRKNYCNMESRYWNLIKGKDWPSEPPRSIKDIQQLDQSIQDELSNQFENTIYVYMEKTSDDVHAVMHNQKLFFTWDCDWYFDGKETAQRVENIYNLLGFTDFHKIDVELYWSKWIEKLHLPPGRQWVPF